MEACCLLRQMVAYGKFCPMAATSATTWYREGMSSKSIMASMAFSCIRATGPFISLSKGSVIYLKIDATSGFLDPTPAITEVGEDQGRGYISHATFDEYHYLVDTWPSVVLGMRMQDVSKLVPIVPSEIPAEIGPGQCYRGTTLHGGLFGGKLTMCRQSDKNLFVVSHPGSGYPDIDYQFTFQDGALVSKEPNAMALPSR